MSTADNTNIKINNINNKSSILMFKQQEQSVKKMNKDKQHRQISMSRLLVKNQIIIIVVITRITVSVSIVVFLTRVRDRRTVVLQRQKKQKTNNKQINNNKQNKQTNKKQTNKHQFSAVAQ